MALRLRDYTLNKDGTTDDRDEVQRLCTDAAKEADPTTLPSGDIVVLCPLGAVGLVMPDPNRITGAVNEGTRIHLVPDNVPRNELPAPVEDKDTTTGIVFVHYPITRQQQLSRL